MNLQEVHNLIKLDEKCQFDNPCQIDLIMPSGSKIEIIVEKMLPNLFVATVGDMDIDRWGETASVATMRILRFLAAQ